MTLSLSVWSKVTLESSCRLQSSSMSGFSDSSWSGSVDDVLNSLTTKHSKMCLKLFTYKFNFKYHHTTKELCICAQQKLIENFTHPLAISRWWWCRKGGIFWVRWWDWLVLQPHTFQHRSCLPFPTQIHVRWQSRISYWEQPVAQDIQERKRNRPFYTQ